MFILDRLLVGGLTFVLDRIREVAESELEEDEGSLREQLLAAQMQLELGEIGEEELAEVESYVFARLRELRGDRPPEALSFDSGAGVEVSFGGDEEEAGPAGDELAPEDEEEAEQAGDELAPEDEQEANAGAHGAAPRRHETDRRS